MWQHEDVCEVTGVAYRSFHGSDEAKKGLRKLCFSIGAGRDIIELPYADAHGRDCHYLFSERLLNKQYCHSEPEDIGRCHRILHRAESPLKSAPDVGYDWCTLCTGVHCAAH